MRVKKSERGFELIEGLIVIAIIGIVPGIAIPNLISAINQGKFQKSFGIHAPRTPVEKEVIVPLVARKLLEFQNNYNESVSRAKALASDPPADPRAMDAAAGRMSYALDVWRYACASAASYKFPPGPCENLPKE